MITELSPRYSISLLCQVLDCLRSAYYYHPHGLDDTPLEEAIREVAGQWPTYGYRRVTVQIRRDRKWVVNTKRVRRVMRHLGLCGRLRRRKRCTTNGDHPFTRYPNLVAGLNVVRPDQVWVADITCVRLRGEFVYLAVIIEVFTRLVRGWHLGRNLDQTLTLTSLRRALADADQRSITRIRVSNTPSPGTWRYCRHTALPSVWRRWVKPGKMGTQNGWCARQRRGGGPVGIHGLYRCLSTDWSILGGCV